MTTIYEYTGPVDEELAEELDKLGRHDEAAECRARLAAEAEAEAEADRQARNAARADAAFKGIGAIFGAVGLLLAITIGKMAASKEL